MTASRPDQEAAIAAVLGSSPSRVMVEAPPGSGKTAMAVELISRLATGTRVLIIAKHSTLHLVWAPLIAEQVHRSYRVLEGADYYRWLASREDVRGEEIVLLPTSLLRRGTGVELLQNRGWDLVVVDDIDSARGKPSEWIMSVWSSATIDRVVSLTESFEQSVGAKWLLEHADRKYQRLALRRPDKGVQGYPLFFSYDEEEWRLVDTITQLLLDPQLGIPRRARQGLREAASSSLFTFAERARRVASADIRLPAAFLAGRGQDPLEDDDEELTDVIESRLAIGDLFRMKIAELVDEIDALVFDSKVAEAVAFVESRPPQDTVLVTKFRDTAYYLEQVVTSAEMVPLLITGESHLQERARMMDHARRGQGVLIASLTALQGFEIDWAARFLHYELPTEPESLRRRMTVSYWRSAKAQQFFMIAEEERANMSTELKDLLVDSGESPSRDLG